ncbi:MAG: tRNA (adenosine(37)-N6)-threonylcarbamoyltransferase complex ATPase subunit type 1 TsaE [Myxococcota bacterium]|nr:tRNA (adenosine(37)-N6)-threonylcarbamoyltransferase complex ATPase subunit type 1 TsaE [Myxococcota bacterium]
MQIHLPNAEATVALGQRVAELAYPGLVVALRGELGGGKTTFAQGVGRGLGVQGRVSSPTFIILALHSGRLTLAHADLYRLCDAEELVELGLDEHMEQGVALIEWAERFPEVLPADHLEIHLQDEGEGRRATLSATGPRAQGLLESLG